MSEQRKHLRTPLRVDFKIWREGAEERLVKTRDISDGGVYLITEGFDDVPPVGTLLKGQVQGLMEDAPVVTLKIVRLEPLGMGLQFIEE